jgi:hypothetical protein
MSIFCQKCYFPESGHVWVSHKEFEAWRPVAGHVKQYCTTRTTKVYCGIEKKIYAPDMVKLPENPCTVEDMLEIST